MSSTIPIYDTVTSDEIESSVDPHRSLLEEVRKKMSVNKKALNFTVKSRNQT